MGSAYLAKVAVVATERAALDKAVQEKIEKIEAEISVCRDKEKLAMDEVLREFRKGKITVIDRDTFVTEIKNETSTEVAKLEGEIRKLWPSWTSTLSAGIAKAANKAATKGLMSVGGLLAGAKQRLDLGAKRAEKVDLEALGLD